MNDGVTMTVARGRKGAPATATIYHANSDDDGNSFDIIEVVEAPTAAVARQLGKLALRRHLRVALLLS